MTPPGIDALAPELTEALRIPHKRWRLRRPPLAIYWPELLAVIVALESLLAAMLARHFRLAGHVPWMDYYLLWLVPAGCVFMAVVCVWLWRLYRSGEEHPTRVTLDKLRTTSFRTYLELVVPIVVMAPFLASHTTYKVLLGNFTPYTADPMLNRLDGLLGVQPWQISHALFGPFATMLLDRLYYAWFLVNHVMLMALLFVPLMAKHRAQVLLSFVLSWIVLGTIVALLFPSVGPCYYGHFYGHDAYADLMLRLHQISETHPLTALGVQERLLVDHNQDMVALGSGISAMPSMHVSIATITGLLLRRMGFAWLGWAWVGAIWLGSFHLGWHYASDGLVSFVVTLAIWKCVARLLEDGKAPTALPEQ